MTDEQMQAWLALPVLEDPSHQTKIEHVERASSDSHSVSSSVIASAMKRSADHVWGLLDAIQGNINAGKTTIEYPSNGRVTLEGNLTMSRIAFEYRVVDRHGQTFVHALARIGITVAASAIEKAPEGESLPTEATL